MSDNKLLDIAAKAEQDLNSSEAKTGSTNPADSATESGIDQGVANKFSEFGATAEYGSSTSGQGDNREIPESEGGGVQKGTGRMTKAGDFEGGAPGQGPEDIAQQNAAERGGDDDVRGNIRN